MLLMGGRGGGGGEFGIEPGGSPLVPNMGPDYTANHIVE